MDGASEFRLVTVDDERLPLATRALDLIVHSIGDVQPVEDLLTEVEERRRGMPSGGNYHLLAMVDEAEHPVAAAAGVYLKGVNAGFITYLAVRQDQRGREIGRTLRTELVNAMRAEARETAGRDLDWVVGEVRRESPWLRTLVSYIDPRNERSIRLAERLGARLDPRAAQPEDDPCLVFRHPGPEALA